MLISEHKRAAVSEHFAAVPQNAQVGLDKRRRKKSFD